MCKCLIYFSSITLNNIHIYIHIYVFLLRLFKNEISLLFFGGAKIKNITKMLYVIIIIRVDFFFIYLSTREIVSKKIRKQKIF